MELDDEILATILQKIEFNQPEVLFYKFLMDKKLRVMANDRNILRTQEFLRDLQRGKIDQMREDGKNKSPPQRRQRQIP
jgi:hypothetical protein